MSKNFEIDPHCKKCGYYIGVYAVERMKHNCDPILIKQSEPEQQQVENESQMVSWLREYIKENPEKAKREWEQIKAEFPEQPSPTPSESEREIERVVYEALGTASMCWSPKPSTQVFDSTLASERGKKLTDYIIGLLKEKDEELVFLHKEISSALKRLEQAKAENEMLKLQLEAEERRWKDENGECMHLRTSTGHTPHSACYCHDCGKEL